MHLNARAHRETVQGVIHRAARASADAVAASLALLVGSAAVVVAAHSTSSSLLTILALPLVVGGLLHLLVRRRLRRVRARPGPQPRLHRTAGMLTVSSLSCACLLYHETPARPDAYFVLLGLAVTGVLLQAGSDGAGRRPGFVLAQSLILAALLRAHSLFESPGLPITDVMGHMPVIEAWLSDGHISPWTGPNHEWTSYYDFPLMHICVIGTALVTGLSIKPALYAAVSLPFVAGLLFVHSTAARDLGRAAGVGALIFAAVEAQHVFWGTALIPTTMGVTLFCAIAWMALFWRRSLAHVVLYGLLCIALTLTHTASAFITLIAVLAMVLVRPIDRCLLPSQSGDGPPAGALVLLGCPLLVRWVHSSYTEDLSFFQMVVRGLVTAARDVSTLTPNAIGAAEQNPLDWLWLGLATLLFTLGGLACLHAAIRSPRRWRLLAAVALLSATVLCFVLLGMRNILPHRWLPFVLSLGAPLSLLGLLSITRSLKETRASAVRLTVLVAFTFLSLFSTPVNPRTPLCGVPVPTLWSDAEDAAGARLAMWQPQQMTTDTYFRSLGGALRARVDWHPLSVRGDPSGLLVTRSAVRNTMTEVETGTWQPGAADNESAEQRLFAAAESSRAGRVYASRGVDVISIAP